MAAALFVLAAAALAVGAHRARASLAEARIHLFGVVTAGVFAAQ